MPLVRIDLRKGKPAAYKKAIGDAVYRAMRETFVVPDEDRFMVVTEHDEDEFFYSKTYLNIERTDDLVLIQLTVTNSRNVDQKKALFARIVELLAQPGQRMADSRLGSPKPLRGACDASFGHEDVEHNQQVEVETAQIDFIHDRP